MPRYNVDGPLNDAPDPNDPTFTDDEDMNFQINPGSECVQLDAPQVPIMESSNNQKLNSMEQRPTVLLFTGNFDAEYPMMKPQDILPWQLFT
jgi:hypothetical protein